MRMNQLSPSSFVVTMKNQVSVVLAISAAVVLMSMLASPVSCDDAGTNFFLKASKSVPRIGRRSDNFFLKASKSVPRIGRRLTLSPLVEGHDSVVTSSWPWFRNADSIPGPSRRNAEVESNTGSFRPADEDQYEENLTWESLEKAMEENPEMWTPSYLMKIMSQHKEDLAYQRHLQAMSNQV